MRVLESISERKGVEVPFTQEQVEVINSRLKVLSPLCRMVSGDLKMQVEVNPEKGWHWNFKDNVVRCDAKDLLEKPIDYLRFVIQHEAGHRKISRVTGIIPDSVWQQTGFSFLTNAIEDPRMNNYVADSIPKFKQEMIFSYDLDSEFEAEMKKKTIDKIGVMPRFMMAGFEYIKMWIAEVKGEFREIDKSLPKEVQDVVAKTLSSARKSWLTYPSKDEADKGIEFEGKKLSSEETILEYARSSFQINYEEIWPFFKTLVDEDIEDVKNKIKSDPKDKLSDEQVSAVAKGLIKEIENELSKHFESKSEEKNQSDDGKVRTKKAKPDVTKTKETKESKKTLTVDVRKTVEDAKIRMEEDKRKSKSNYDDVLAEVAPIITRLEDELREIFIERKRNAWKSGFKSGKAIDIAREIKSEARQVDDLSPFMRRELPVEKDYAIEVLVDLSGSMKEGKIEETYKAVVVLCEALKNIGIKLSVTGFNDRLYPYKGFDETYNDEKRNETQKMLIEVGLFRDTDDTEYFVRAKAAYNDDGWAVQEVVDRIRKRSEKQKIVFVLSDGLPVPSPGRTHFDLGEIVKNIEDEGDVHIVGLGIGPGTYHVEKYYKDHIANVGIKEFAERLAAKVKEVIEK